jgi:hypothetical protein
MRKERLVFKIDCKELTPERKKILAADEVMVVGRPLRIILAAGGVYMFFHGTSGEAALQQQYIAGTFTMFGIAAVLFAIFAQKLIEANYFAKARRSRCFPEGVSVAEGGVYIRRADKESYVSFSGVNTIEEKNDYFKIRFLQGDTASIFLFKNDFELGEPEAFVDYFLSK